MVIVVRIIGLLEVCNRAEIDDRIGYRSEDRILCKYLSEEIQGGLFNTVDHHSDLEKNLFRLLFRTRQIIDPEQLFPIIGLGQLFHPETDLIEDSMIFSVSHIV